MSVIHTVSDNEQRSLDELLLQSFKSIFWQIACADFEYSYSADFVW